VTAPFRSPLARQLAGFLEFKRRLGYTYARAEFTLREFDAFLVRYAATSVRWRFDQAALAWLASKPQRKALSVSADAAVLRQFCRYGRRLPSAAPLQEPLWPRLPTTCTFVPAILTAGDVRRLLVEAAGLTRPHFRAAMYRALLLVLYCTGLRFGEALRLRMRDVDSDVGVLFVAEFKGRARWVPVHRSLARELVTYIAARRAFAPSDPDHRFFVGGNRQTLPVSTAWHTINRLFRSAGLKRGHGRVGPRPYDLRHTFAVHRLAQWYRQGVDLHARLPWLSAYMGHFDILGTETYLTATPALLGLATSRFRRRYLSARHESGGGP
jgi:integrase/recombinase XerD